ncbi:hypothetical protein [Streptomyces sp. SYSU K217416]
MTTTLSRHTAPAAAPAASWPARPRWTASVAITAVCVLSVTVAVLQTRHGTLLSDIGLTGDSAPVFAAVLGMFDALFVTLGCALVVWLCGAARRVPDRRWSGVLAVTSCALLGAIAIEMAAVAVELTLTGAAPTVLATSPARWTGMQALGALSVSNVLLYAGLVTGLVRGRRWPWATAVLPVLVLAAVAALASALV